MFENVGTVNCNIKLELNSGRLCSHTPNQTPQNAHSKSNQDGHTNSPAPAFTV